MVTCLRSALRVAALLPALTAAASARKESPAAAASSCRAQGSCPSVAKEDVLLQARFSVHSEAGLAAHDDDWINGKDYGEYDYEDVAAERAFDEKAFDKDEFVAGRKASSSLVEDWMMETTLDNEWISGGDASDKEYLNLPRKSKTSFVQVAHKVADSILQEGGKESATDRKIWMSKFRNEHLRAVKVLNHRPYLTTAVNIPSTRYAGAGGLSGLYTYGSPGTALAPLTNVLAKDGKFPGLRLVTQRVYRIGRIVRKYHDPVPWFAGLVGMKHAKMDLLILPAGYTPEMHEVCDDVVRRPRSDMAFWIKGHFQPTYYAHFEAHKDKFDPKAWTMLHMSKAVSPGINKHSRVGNARWAAKVGWNLVAQSVAEHLGETDIIYRDNTSLYQDPVSKACTLSFVGTHHITQWLVNLRFRRGKFCGIPNVHRGFRNQVRRVIWSKKWKSEMIPALHACPELYITGHSLGAAQGQLVAACMQRAPAEGQDGWEDYQHLIWTPAGGQVLPALVSPDEITEYIANERAEAAAAAQGEEKNLKKR